MIKDIEEEENIKLMKQREVEEKRLIKEKRPKKVCPYCGWSTYDVDGKAHAFQIHLCKKHPEINYKEHLKKYPEDELLLKGLIDKGNKVRCHICGKYLHLIDDRHLAKHHITKEEYEKLYGKDSLISTKTKEKLYACWKKMVLNENFDKYTSSYEVTIHNFLKENGIDFKAHNRHILKTNELDILIEEKNIAIEVNGNLWHTEFFGKKDKNYHLNKTLVCNENGIDLIHIFEDELKYKKEIVFSYLKRILDIDKSVNESIDSVVLKEINNALFEEDLNKNSLQFFKKSKKYMGIYKGEEIISGLSFSFEKDKIKIINYFNKTNDNKLYRIFLDEIKEKYKNVKYIEGFADRRWYSERRNIFLDMGFILDSYTEPEIYFYNRGNNKALRFEKDYIVEIKKQYDIGSDVTDLKEILNLSNFDIIWNCGYLKYRLTL